jgi:hypothetical protein
MPAFKYLKKNSLIVFERGHEARAYKAMSPEGSIRYPPRGEYTMRQPYCHLGAIPVSPRLFFVELMD